MRLLCRLWEGVLSSCLACLREHTQPVYSLAFSPDASLLLQQIRLTFACDCRLWDGESGSCLACLREHTQPVYSLAFSPDGSLLASGSFDRALHVWRTSDGACLRTFTGVPQPLAGVVWRF